MKYALLNCLYILKYKQVVRCNTDILAEWLRRWIANPLLFERESSNLSDVETLFAPWLLIVSTAVERIIITVRSPEKSPCLINDVILVTYPK